MGATKEPVMEQKWQKYEQKMDNNSITVETLINGVSFKPALINTGYECYSIVDKDLITELRLPRVKSRLNRLQALLKKTLRNPG